MKVKGWLGELGNKLCSRYEVDDLLSISLPYEFCSRPLFLREFARRLEESHSLNQPVAPVYGQTISCNDGRRPHD